MPADGAAQIGRPVFFSSPKVNTVKKLLPSVLSAAVLGLAMLAPVGAADLRIGVVNMERTNIRYVTPEQLGEPLDLSVVDVSFISLKLVLPVIKTLLKPTGQVLCLIKPQFEAGREKVGKKGVVRDPAVHLEVLEHFLDHAGDAGFTVLGLTYSPIRGPEGNIEYLGYLEKGPRQERTFDLKALVDESHQTLKEHGEGTV